MYSKEMKKGKQACSKSQVASRIENYVGVGKSHFGICQLSVMSKTAKCPMLIHADTC
jgi:hypothetical protein